MGLRLLETQRGVCWKIQWVVLNSASQEAGFEKSLVWTKGLLIERVLRWKWKE